MYSKRSTTLVTVINIDFNYQLVSSCLSKNINILCVAFIISGDNIDEHFRKIAFKQVAPYTKLGDELAYYNLPPKPKVCGSSVT